MSEQRLNEKQFELLLEELRRDRGRARSHAPAARGAGGTPRAIDELSRLSTALETLAYAAIGREGPRLRRRA